MADKTVSDREPAPYQPGNFDIGVDAPHKSTWTDGLPHDFKGWGPRTPDPENEPAPEGELHWHGEYDDHTHHVWRFDLRRHHHH